MKLLIKGENLDVLTYLLDKKKLAGKIDLIYTDPSFATNIDFTMFKGRASTISKTIGGEIAYLDKLLGSDFVQYIKQRLVIMRKLLSEQGSIYLHTDYKIGHYLRVMMDDVFGIDNFRNDITRIKCNPKNFNRIGFGNIKDMILFYTKTAHPIWNEPRQPYTEDDIKRLYPKVDDKGRRYTTVPIHAPGETKLSQKFKGMLPPMGRHWRTDVKVLEKWDEEGLLEWSSTGNPRKIIYADERKGKRVQDIWTDFKDPQYPCYPTEKNLDFIDFIVKTSSNAESIVLDPFCGSGTSLLAAAKNGRQWIGIDKSDLAIKVAKHKLGYGDTSIFGSDIEFMTL